MEIIISIIILKFYKWQTNHRS